MTKSTTNKAGRLKKKLTPGDLSVFCMQLSLILKAGIPLYEGLSVLSSKDGSYSGETTPLSGALGTVISAMAKHTESGGTLLSAMNLVGVFPEYAVHMVEIGESAGKLDSALEALGDYYEREQFLKVKIRNSLMYPMFLFIIMSAVIILLVGKVFPIFSDMLESMGGSLSDAGTAASDFSNSLAAGGYAMYIILSLAALTVLIFLFSRTKIGGGILNRFTAVFPLTKDISRKVSASRFANAVSMSLSSGMDMSSVVRLAVNLADSAAYKKKFQACLNDVDAGVRLPDAIAKIGVFSAMQIKFIEIGQKTGSIDSVMKRVADSCGEEAENAISNAVSLIEPFLVGILSVIIGIILIAVMIPLVQIMSNIA